MKIHLDKIETHKKCNGLGLKRTIDSSHYSELYLDTDLDCYIAIRKPDESDSKYSGKIIIERGVVAVSQIAEVSIPKYQPIGTTPERDTPSGKKRKSRTDKTAKSAIAARIEERKSK